MQRSIAHGWLHFVLRLFFWTAVGTAGAGFALQQLSETDPERMWAFVVGISNYTHAAPLNYAATDAQAFADFLQSPRGGSIPRNHIALLLEEKATRTGIEHAMERFWDKIQEGDTVYVYIAGHGFVHRRRIGYFLPIDGDPTSPNSTAISLLALQQSVFFGFEPAKSLVMISDMCHSGVLADQQNAINQLLLTAFGEPDEGKNLLNLVASGQDEPSWEDSGLGHGVFTYALLQALNGEGIEAIDPLVQAQEVVEYVQQEVPRRTANQQNPETNEIYDPSLPLSFLNRPGPSPVMPGTGTVLVLVNTGQKSYLRAQWIDPQNESIAVRPIPEGAGEVALGPLAPGALELTLFDAENHPSRISLTLQEGENRFDLQASQVGELRLEARPPLRQVASMAALSAPGAWARPQAPQDPLPASAARIAEPRLILNLEAGSEVYVNGNLYASLTDGSRPLQLQGLGHDPVLLLLVYSPEHEQRFRLKLLPGPQWFDPATRQLQPIRELGKPPAFTPPPAGLSANQEDLYRRFQQALWEERLIEPAGDSAWDYYAQLRPALEPDLGEELRGQLAVAMGDQAQRIILKYLEGGDTKWNAAIFEKGSDLTVRLRQLFEGSALWNRFPQIWPASYRSQEFFFDGRASIERKQFAQARSRLQQSIQLQPEASHSWNAIGLAHWQENQLEQALPPLERAIELTPFWNYPRITRALVLLQLRRYEEAEAAFREAIGTRAEDSTAYHGLGQLFFVTGRWQPALQELQRAIQFNPGNAYAYHTLGQLEQRLQRFGEAEESFRLAIRLEPEEPSFRMTLARMFRELGRVAEAANLLADLSGRHPENVEVLTAYAEFLGSVNREEEANAVFRRALQLAPDDANLRVSHGIFLLGRNRRKDAENEFKRALKADSQNAFAHYQLAQLYFADQQVEKAEKSAQQANESDPRYAPPYRLLGQIAFARRRQDEALRFFRKSRDLATEAHQKQELQEAIVQIESTIVEEQLLKVAELEGEERATQAWELLGQTLARAPESRQLRNRILDFQASHPEVSPAALPTSTARQVLESPFWKSQLQAEQSWKRGETAAALELFDTSFRQLDDAQLEALGSTAFNFENEVAGIHGLLYRWGLRQLERGGYETVADWMELARRRWIFVAVPDYSPLTVDSLMRPSDAVNPQRFEEFEVAHHPDHRAHELLAAAAAGAGNQAKALDYLEALEHRRPNLPARRLVAEALHRQGGSVRAESLLVDALEGAGGEDDQDQRARAWILLAQIQCDSGRCEEAAETVQRGLAELPGNELLKKARTDLRR